MNRSRPRTAGNLGVSAKKQRTQPGPQLEQMLLDFGQKGLGKKAVCPVCSFMYTKGDPDDEHAHTKYCDPWLHGVPHPAEWRAEKTVDSDLNGDRVIEIKTGGSSMPIEKVGLETLFLSELVRLIIFADFRSPPDYGSRAWV